MKARVKNRNISHDGFTTMSFTNHYLKWHFLGFHRPVAPPLSPQSVRSQLKHHSTKQRKTHIIHRNFANFIWICFTSVCHMHTNSRTVTRLNTHTKISAGTDKHWAAPQQSGRAASQRIWLKESEGTRHMSLLSSMYSNTYCMIVGVAWGQPRPLRDLSFLLESSE